MQAELYAAYQHQLQRNPKSLIADLTKQRHLGVCIAPAEKAAFASNAHAYSDWPKLAAVQRSRRRQEPRPSRGSLGRAFSGARPAQSMHILTPNRVAVEVGIITESADTLSTPIPRRRINWPSLRISPTNSHRSEKLRQRKALSTRSLQLSPRMCALEPVGSISTTWTAQRSKWPRLAFQQRIHFCGMVGGL